MQTPGRILTVEGTKGTYNNRPDGEPLVLNSRFVSLTENGEIYLVFPMFIKTSLSSEAGSYEFDVYSNTTWTVTASEGAHVEIEDGALCARQTLIYSANTDTRSYKHYTLTFKYADKENVLKFTQSSLEP